MVDPDPPMKKAPAKKAAAKKAPAKKAAAKKAAAEKEPAAPQPTPRPVTAPRSLSEPPPVAPRLATSTSSPTQTRSRKPFVVGAGLLVLVIVKKVLRRRR